MEFPAHLYYKEGVRRLDTSDAPNDLLTLKNSHKRIKSFQGTGNYPLLSLNHLAVKTDVKYKFLRSVVQRRYDPYTTMLLSKYKDKTGSMKKRIISKPDPQLMPVQRWILDHCLVGAKASIFSFAYEKDKSIVDCVSPHLGCKWLIKLDLHNFFGSVSEKRVKFVFSEMGYSDLLSFELSRLCTRVIQNNNISRKQIYSDGEMGVLPQGSPTSGALANCIASNLDSAISNYADEHCWTYSRYSDDLIFSSCSQHVDDHFISGLIKYIREIVKTEGFYLHENKIRIARPGNRKIALGLLVDSDNVRLPKYYWNYIENHIYGAGKFGLVDHSANSGFDSIFGFINHINGKLAYAYGISPDRVKKYYTTWNDIVGEAVNFG